MKIKYLFLSLVLISSITCSADSYYFDDLHILYTRITQISWPPDYKIDTFSLGVYTRFSFAADYEIINNGSKLVITVHKIPYIIPRMNASLVNSSLNPAISYVFFWPIFDVTFNEGITNVSSGISFSVAYYSNQTFPLGNYTFWFDATSDLNYVIQLLPFYTTINITENHVNITHHGTNKTITYPEQTTEISFNLISSLIVFIIPIRRKRRKLVSFNQLLF